MIFRYLGLLDSGLLLSQKGIEMRFYYDVLDSDKNIKCIFTNYLC